MLQGEILFGACFAKIERRKIMKKATFLLSLICAMSALGGLTSCNKSDKIRLKIGFWPENTETRDIAMYEQWKKSFEADYPQYEIVADHYTYDTSTVGSKHITGTLPTVFETWFTEPAKLVNKKYIRSITKQLKAVGWDEKMDENMKKSLTFDEEIYGIPRDGYGLGLLINTKTFVENGLLEEDENGKAILYDEQNNPLYPTTFEEIYQASLTIAENTETKGILICSANKNGGWQFSNMAWNFGAELETIENGKVKANLAGEESIKALTWIQKMKSEELLLNSPSVTYDQWYNSIDEKVAMAIVGSDVLQLAKTQGNVDMKDLAFVPMPTGDGVHHYSLYGGTPFVFSSEATDEQVEGVLKFFEYTGRTPNVSEISKAAMVAGNETAKNKNQPILPTIKPWTNSEYVSYAEELEKQYVNVDMYYFEEFFDHINEYQHAEVPYAAQEMYEYLDIAIQAILVDPYTTNPQTLLQTANSKLQSFLDKNYNK